MCDGWVFRRFPSRVWKKMKKKKKRRDSEYTKRKQNRCWHRFAENGKRSDRIMAHEMARRAHKYMRYTVVIILQQRPSADTIRVMFSAVITLSRKNIKQ